MYIKFLNYPQTHVFYRIFCGFKSKFEKGEFLNFEF
jgi:hypothetical protein